MKVVFIYVRLSTDDWSDACDTEEWCRALLWSAFRWPANGMFRRQHFVCDSVSAYVIEESAAIVGESITRRVIEDAPLKIICMETREDNHEICFDLGRPDPTWKPGERTGLVINL